MSKGVQVHLKIQIFHVIKKQGDGRKDQRSRVNGRSWASAEEANDPKWKPEVKDKGEISQG